MNHITGNVDTIDILTTITFYDKKTCESYKIQSNTTISYMRNLDTAALIISFMKSLNNISPRFNQITCGYNSFYCEFPKVRNSLPLGAKNCKFVFLQRHGNRNKPIKQIKFFLQIRFSSRWVALLYVRL